MQRERATSLEERSRALFDDSVAAVDMRVRSRLTRARHAALESARPPAARLLGLPMRAVAASAAAVMLGAALWLAWTAATPPADPVDGRATVEDLDLVAASEPGRGDALDMMQEDVDFYAWAARRGDGSAAGHAG